MKGSRHTCGTRDQRKPARGVVAIKERGGEEGERRKEREIANDRKKSENTGGQRKKCAGGQTGVKEGKRVARK